MSAVAVEPQSKAKALHTDHHFQPQLYCGLARNSLAKEHIQSPVKEGSLPLSKPEKAESILSITVVGASGDLAKKKIFPALFALFYEDCLPEDFMVFGYALTEMTDEELRNIISRTLTCRIDKSSKQFIPCCCHHGARKEKNTDQ